MMLLVLLTIMSSLQQEWIHIKMVMYPFLWKPSILMFTRSPMELLH
ncbi:hypothetical protein GLYMA_15G235950v4 [Glycine max]|nr:hypothetical protein GLYMA_15G235950v4 [Glycine max]KAH1148576.1 hypothetical protein GYH30_043284 [Glycine max]